MIGRRVQLGAAFTDMAVIAIVALVLSVAGIVISEVVLLAFLSIAGRF